MIDDDDTLASAKHPAHLPVATVAGTSSAACASPRAAPDSSAAGASLSASNPPPPAQQQQQQSQHPGAKPASGPKRLSSVSKKGSDGGGKVAKGKGSDDVSAAKQRVHLLQGAKVRRGRGSRV